MTKKFTEDEEEYTRLNQELIMRIDKIYADGAIVTSIIFIYLITCIGVLCKVYSFLLTDGIKYTNILCVLINLLSIILFLFPILLCYTFALKSKEIMDSILSLAHFIKFYYEKPCLIDGRIRGKKWETLHKNTMIDVIDYERKEYYFISLISYILIFVCGFTEIFIVLTFEPFNSLAFWVIILVKIGFIFYATVMTNKIRHITDRDAVFVESKSAGFFYKNQKISLEQCENDELLVEKIKRIENDDFVFRMFLVKHRIPHYKALELEKLFYDEKYNEDDKLIKKIDKNAQKKNKNIENKKERIKTYLRDDINKICEKYS